MCCFSRTVEHVAQTKIFARASTDGRQFLSYAMTLEAPEDLAMVLPLPVPPSPPEDALRFIDLSGYPNFFADLDRAFQPPPSRGPISGAIPQPATLKVHEVGSFEASFVPAPRDFDRLDERFRLPPSAFDAVPHYHDYGFAVFKLKRGKRSIHPMAFEFPRRSPNELFFPTLHVHDGRVHAKARFDHAIYCQTENPPARWETSDTPAGGAIDAPRAQRLIDPDARLHRLTLVGDLPNRDTVI